MAVLARVSKLAITITTIFTISMVCLATNTEPKLAALLSLVREHATPRKVIHLLGNPQYCFLPDADKGFAGKADQLVFRYEHLLKEQIQTDVQVWVVLGNNGCQVERIDVQYESQLNENSYRELIFKEFGKPDRIVHVGLIGSIDDEELSLGNCDDPKGENEIWLYSNGVDVYCPSKQDKYVNIVMHSPTDITKEYPKCK